MKSELRVFHWLQELSGENTAYLRMLNLTFPEEETSEYLALWRSLARKIKSDRGYYWELLKHRNWRMNLVACICLLAANDRDSQKHLERRFLRGGFVSPQVAVALALLHPCMTKDFFRVCHQSEFRGVKARSKEMGAIHALLPYLSPQEEITSKGIVDDSEFQVGERVARKHYAFWYEVVPKDP